MILLRTEQLTVSIANKTICRDLTIEAKAGEIWGILGPNGSGKTTLLHTLAGLHPVISGEIWLENHKLAALSMKAIARFLGILFQDFDDTFVQTVFDYCLAARFPHLHYFQRERKYDRQIVTQALRQMDMASLEHQSIHQLSGGEKRRLSIASLLAQKPKVYLLDEPTNHLDMRHQINTLRIFSALAKEESATVFMALHDVNLAQQFCDHILLLFGDGSTLKGNHKAILTVENLTRLYQHPLKNLNHGMWWPE